MRELQLGLFLNQRGPKIVERHAVQNEPQRIGLIAKLDRRRRENTFAVLTLPELYEFQLLRRVPLRISRRALQCGQRPGRLAVYSARCGRIGVL